MTKFYRLGDVSMVGVSDSITRNVDLIPTEQLPKLTEFGLAVKRFSKSKIKDIIIYSVFSSNWSVVVDKGVLSLFIKGHDVPVKFKTSLEITQFKRLLTNQ